MTRIDTHAFDVNQSSKARRTQTFVFVLLPDYLTLDIATAVEVLSKANAAGASPAFDWRIVTETGKAQPSTSGLDVGIDGALDHVDWSDTIVLCGGTTPACRASLDLLAWLRKASSHGTTIAAIGAGCVVLAEAGLTSGQSVAAHWAIAPALREEYPDSDVQESVFQLEQRALTCAGGGATLDFFLSLVAQRQDTDCAHATAASLACSHIRDADSAQVISTACRHGRKSAHLTSAIEMMTDSLETPHSTRSIAAEIGISQRQLERLFSRHLNTTPKAYNDSLRLDRARCLLQQTQLSTMDVSVACGFHSVSHFSKRYRARFGNSPDAETGLPSR